ADGYARASGRLTACNVHVAPGLGNAMGSLFNAQFSGSPIIVAAGQQEQGHGLMEPILYGPVVQMAQPLVKWAVEVTRVEDLPRIVRRAAKIATTPPTGPVFMSLPGDILNGEAELDLGKSSRVERFVRPSDEIIDRLARRLLSARNPVIIVGTEVAAYDAWKEAAELAELLGAPVYQQSVPDAAHFPSDHAAYQGTLSRDQPQVRKLLEPHDLLVSLGGDSLRMSVYSPTEPLPDGMPVVQIGERGWDLAKNYPAEYAVQANVRETLAALLPVLRRLRSPERSAEAQRRLAALGKDNWSTRRVRFAQEMEAHAARQPIDPRYLMVQISEALPPDATVLEEAVTGTRPLLTCIPYRDSRSFYGLASGGIGFAMGGAVGISLALPDRPIVAVIGDGSALYSIQALWSAAHLALPITYVIINNRSYRVLKERMISMRGAREFTGMDFHEPPIAFTQLAQSFGVKASRITAPGDIRPALNEAIASRAPRLLEFMVDDGFGGSTKSGAM
ncbi:MAG TPA: thiamine pyrophosphate-dependent enzyme, partial [Burkholderiales bacterium]|nr:thiamine pyrophosphate-dependent enzyme [Burkholderiales bacterium]